MKANNIIVAILALAVGTAAVPLCAATFEFACDRPDGATRMFPYYHFRVAVLALRCGIWYNVRVF